MEIFLQLNPIVQAICIIIAGAIACMFLYQWGKIIRIRSR